jgi:hypothetical protein
MGYFVRRYQKGVKNSGCKDIFRSEEPISVAELVDFANQTGPGKYVLGVRGNGIRGWKKITDVIVESHRDAETETAIFAAESISVRKNMKLEEMNDNELMDLLYSMSRKTPSPEEFSTYQSDLGKIHAELSKRNVSKTTSAAETATVGGKSPVASAGFAVGGKSAAAMGMMAGLVIGALGTSWYYKSQIDDLKSTIDRFDKKLSEAEDYMKRAEQKEAKKDAESQAANRFDAMSNLNNFLLGDFNKRNGPQFN